MWYLTGWPTQPGEILWSVGKEAYTSEDDTLAVVIRYTSLLTKPQRREAIRMAAHDVRECGIGWLTPGEKEWVIDLDQVKVAFPDLASVSWLRGKVSASPDVEIEEGAITWDGNPRPCDVIVALYVVPELVGRTIMPASAPVEIQESLARFRVDHPDPTKVAFIMMRFGNTSAHTKIVSAIRGVLGKVGITALRADDKEYHADLYYNVLTYIYGCSFGIAIFERIEQEDFNPNVALEVGYMSALGKPICLLKDKTLKSLHTDLVGKLYRVFDPQHPGTTIPGEVERWLSDKGLPSSSESPSPGPPAAAGSPPSGVDADWQRQNAIIARLRQEYIRRGDNMGPSMVSGLDPLPKEWVEAELERMGETWRRPRYWEMDQPPSQPGS